MAFIINPHIRQEQPELRAPGIYLVADLVINRPTLTGCMDIQRLMPQAPVHQCASVVEAFGADVTSHFASE